MIAAEAREGHARTSAAGPVVSLCGIGKRFGHFPVLGSIFFSGFAFNLEQITWPVKGLSFAFPATYAMRTVQDVMLRGQTGNLADFAALGAIAVGFLMLNLVPSNVS